MGYPVHIGGCMPRCEDNRARLIIVIKITTIIHTYYDYCDDHKVNYHRVLKELFQDIDPKRIQEFSLEEFEIWKIQNA